MYTPMNTQKATVITVITTVFIIIALFAWAALRSTSAPSTPNTDTVTSDSLSGTGALASLLTKNTDMKCSFTFDTPGLGKGDGVALINKEGHIRSDAVAVQNNTSTGYHVLNDGIFVYTWSGAEGEMPSGTVLRLNAETTMDVMQGKPIPAIETVYMNVTYTCAPWAAEITAYIPPPQVKFVDFALALQQIIEGVPVVQ